MELWLQTQIDLEKKLEEKMYAAALLRNKRQCEMIDETLSLRTLSKNDPKREEINQHIIELTKATQIYDQFFPIIAETYAEIQSYTKEQLEDVEDLDKFINDIFANKINALSQEDLQHSVTVDDLEKAIADLDKINHKEMWNDQFETEVIGRYFTENDDNFSLANRAIGQIAMAMQNKTVNMFKYSDRITVEKANFEKLLNKMKDKQGKNGKASKKIRSYKNRLKTLSKKSPLKKQQYEIISKFNELFPEFGSKDKIEMADLKQFINDKFIKPTYDINELNNFISEIQSYLKSNQDDKVNHILICVQQLRNAITYRRTFESDLAAKSLETKNEIDRINNEIKSKLPDFNGYNPYYQRTLFLIASRCDETTRNEIFAKLKNPNRDTQTKFIGNEALHKFIDANTDKVSTLMWGFLHQPKVFNNSLPWAAKVKIFAVNERDTRRGDLLANRNVLLNKMEDKNITKDQAALLAIMYDRANIFNCRSIIRQMSDDFLKKLEELCKKFDLDENEKETLIDYVYRNRDDFLNKTGADLDEAMKSLEEACQNELGFLTDAQKNIIDSLSDVEDKNAIREAMKNKTLRDLIVDTNSAKNLLYIGVNNFVDKFNAWAVEARMSDQDKINAAKYFLQHINLDDLFDAISNNQIDKNQKNEVKKVFSGLFFKQYLMQIKTQKDFDDFREEINSCFNKDFYGQMRDLSLQLYEKRTTINDPTDIMDNIREFFRKDDKKAPLFITFKPVIDSLVGLTYEFEKVTDESLKFLLPYIDTQPDKIASYFVKLPYEQVDNVLKKIKRLYKGTIPREFENKVISARSKIIKKTFEQNDSDYNKFKSYLKNEKYAYSLIRHVNSVENTKTIFELLEAGLNDPAKVTTKDLEYARQLISGGHCKSDDIVKFFNSDGKNLAILPKENVAQVFDFANSSELSNLNYPDRIRIANALFKKIGEIKKDPSVVQKFVGDISNEQREFITNNMIDLMIKNVKYVCSLSENYDKDNRHYGLQKMNLTDALISAIDDFYLGLFTKQSTQYLPVYIDTGELKKQVFDDVIENYIDYIAKDASSGEAAESKLDKFFDENKDKENDTGAYVQTFRTLASTNVIFNAMANDYKVISELSDGNFDSKLAEITDNDNLVSYINQNKDPEKIKSIVKNLLNVNGKADDKAIAIKDYVLPKINDQNLVDECRIENSSAAINAIANQIVNNSTEVDFRLFNVNVKLAQAVANSIIKNYPNEAANIAEDLGIENPIGYCLAQNETISQILNVRQKNEEFGPLSKLNSQSDKKVQIEHTRQ